MTIPNALTKVVEKTCHDCISILQSLRTEAPAFGPRTKRYHSNVIHQVTKQFHASVKNTKFSTYSMVIQIALNMRPFRTLWVFTKKLTKRKSAS